MVPDYETYFSLKLIQRYCLRKDFAKQNYQHLLTSKRKCSMSDCKTFRNVRHFFTDNITEIEYAFGFFWYVKYQTVYTIHRYTVRVSSSIFFISF